MEKGFASEGFVQETKRVVRPNEQLSFYDQVDLVKHVCYLGDRWIVSGRSEAAVTARSRIGFIRYRHCAELLHKRKLWLKMKGMIYQSCVRSAV